MKNLIVASTSTIHGGSYLEYLTDEIILLFKDCKEIIFIPYARPGGMTHNAYTEIAAKFFKKIHIKVTGLHTYDNPTKAINEAKGVFTGGGNTFLLVHMLYRNEVLQPLRESIYKGLPYLGTSAGSNICGPSMQTTNDMPIVYPPSFKTLGVIPYNINAHYLDPDPSSKHMGETRETRIKEFHTQNTLPVIGLREGSWLRVVGDEIILKGEHTARMFEQGKLPIEIASGAV
jgi:dipeptidase E